MLDLFLFGAQIRRNDVARTLLPTEFQTKQFKSDWDFYKRQSQSMRRHLNEVTELKPSMMLEMLAPAAIDGNQWGIKSNKNGLHSKSLFCQHQWTSTYHFMLNDFIIFGFLGLKFPDILGALVIHMYNPKRAWS